MRTFTLILLLITSALLGCSTQPPLGRLEAQTVVAQPIADALNSAVVLYDRNGELVCAGQRIGPTTIVTAHHCLVAATATEAQLEILDDVEASGDEELVLGLMQVLTPARGAVIRYTTYAQTIKAGRDGKLTMQVSRVGPSHAGHDTALLVTAPTSQPWVDMRVSEDLRVGEGVFAIGHPAGLEFTYSRGYVSTLCRWLSGPECWVQVDIAIYGGNSGGGLFDGAGLLVGIASRRIGFNYGFYAPTEAVIRLVAAL
jgi:hypothetical protein